MPQNGPMDVSGSLENRDSTPYMNLFSVSFPVSPQVVGLVTRKDLARYRLGKEGLEELSLAQT